MKVTIPVSFEVETGEDDELTEQVAKSAAGQASFDFLSFCTVSGVNTDTEEVEVHVDGFGKCKVKLTNDNPY
jgi:hypothetical protein